MEARVEAHGPRALTPAERVLYHQIHPFKLATDILSAVGALALFWRHRLAWGIVVSLLPPIVVSAALLRWASLERQRGSALGRYVARWMTPATQAARLAGFIVAAVGAWVRSPAVVGAGLAVVVGAWVRGVFVR